MNPKVSIIIPTFNEAENLPVLLEQLVRVLAARPESFELIVVDDDSPDGTWQAAEALRTQYPRLRVIRRTTGEKGLAPAVVEGWREARGTLLGVIDADLQHPPELLATLLGALQDPSVDVAIASRYTGSGQRLTWNPIRKWVSRGASNLAQAVLPIQARHVTDPMSGYFVIRRGVIQDVSLQPRGYKILLEVLGRGRYRNVAEVPYEFGRRHAGVSKLGASVMRDYLMQLWRLVWVPTGVGRFVRYCLVGASGVVVNMGMLWMLKSSNTLGTLRAGVIAIQCSIINNFLWNEIWTFRDRSRLHPALWDRALRFIHFNLICGMGLVFQVGLLWFFAIQMRWHYLVANALGLGIVTFWNYGLNTTWTWTRLQQQPHAHALPEAVDVERQVSAPRGGASQSLQGNRR